MTDQHPITPPPESVQHWINHLNGDTWRRTHTTDDFLLAACAAEWGANQELEECINWIRERPCTWTVEQLRAARRPQPPSLAEEALEAAQRFYAKGHEDCTDEEVRDDFDIIRHALERLQELEEQVQLTKESD